MEVIVSGSTRGHCESTRRGIIPEVEALCLFNYMLDCYGEQLPWRSSGIMLSQNAIEQGSIVTVRNEVAKVMFLQVSVCPRGVPAPRGCLVGRGGCLVLGMGKGAWSGGVPGLGGGGGIPACTEVDPRERQLLLQMVCILLECILVYCCTNSRSTYLLELFTRFLH